MPRKPALYSQCPKCYKKGFMRRATRNFFHYHCKYCGYSDLKRRI